MSRFERHLSLWVSLCILVGIALGHALPGVFQIIGCAEIAHVNLPVAVLIWLMIISDGVFPVEHTGAVTHSQERA